MSTLSVATWNVLHRIHAINWSEAIALAEPARVEAIAAWVAASDDAVWCLQEVSGDQLAALRASLPDAGIHALGYPRVPRLRRPGPAPLTDPTEHLVTIVRGTSAPARLVHAAAFPTDPGKGALVVELTAGVTVINTHVTYGTPRASQCRELAALARRAAGTAVLLGDFNADRATIVRDLGEGFTAMTPAAGSLPTRPRTDPTAKSQSIDHVIVYNGDGRELTVDDAGGLSDHNPARAAIAIRLT